MNKARAATLHPRSAGKMNGLESAYASELRAQQAAGGLLWWGFETCKLRLATQTFYTPDFMVVAADGVVEFHEVKGFWRDDARVKLKVAAEQFPMFRFLAVQRKKVSGPWVIERFD